MKKILSLVLQIIGFTTITVRAQTPFTNKDSSDINNLHADVLMHGDMWYNPTNNHAQCYSTKDSVEFNAIGGFWISGYDGGNNLHIAAETTRPAGIDFWPGPLDAGVSLSYSTSQNWAKIWKVSRSEIQEFRSMAIHLTTNTPSSVLTWPGKGNVYAQGNGGTALTVANDMAPFVDLNGNGIYEPLSGEYPDIKGDQALWWVWSDNGPTHSATNGIPLGVEIHAIAYCYSRGTLIDNVIYYEYSIVNRSANDYSNVRVAQWAKPALAGGLDDYIGYDSTWRMGIAYDGTNCDGCAAGQPIGSITLPPMEAITMIDLPGDALPNYVHPGCFSYFNNDASYVGNPIIDTQYNNYMRSKNKIGVHLKDDFGGTGVPSNGYNSGPDCNYIFTGDPKYTSQWSECSCNNNPGGRQMVLSSNDFNLNSGSSQKIVLALITTNRGIGGCPNTSFDSIRVVADTAWRIYHNPLPPLSVTNSTSTDNKVTVYPNPAGSELHISYTGNTADQPSITIYNTAGQIMPATIAISNNNAAADITNLAQGLYYVVYKNEAVQTTVKFVKE